MIFDSDDRREPYELLGTDSEDLLDWRQSVAAIARLDQLRHDPKLERWFFQAKPLKDVFHQPTAPDSNDVCEEEPFREQPSLADCGAVLVGPDVVLTARHCIWSEQDCWEMKVLFGFSREYDLDPIHSLEADQVYQCIKRLDFSPSYEDENDWVLVKLDRPVVDRSPLLIKHREILSPQTRLALIGHPTGLPQKLVPYGKILGNRGQYGVYADLDAYVYNSGSPVFDRDTGEIVGIIAGTNLVRDWVFDEKLKCWRSNRVINPRPEQGSHFIKIRPETAQALQRYLNSVAFETRQYLSGLIEPRASIFTDAAVSRSWRAVSKPYYQHGSSVPRRTSPQDDASP